MRLPWMFRTIIALALLATLAACGTNKDESAIRDGLEGLTSTKPSACTSGFSQAFLDQGTFAASSSPASRSSKSCRSNISKLAAKKVDVSDVRIDGKRAEADFSASGGQYAIKKATVVLHKSANKWLLDRLKALELQRPKYDEQQERLAILLKNGLTRKQAACFRRRIERVSDARLAKAIVAADPSYVADPLLVCVVRPELRKNGFTNLQTRCILRRVRGRSARKFVQLTQPGTKAGERAIRGRFRRAAAACTNR